MRMLINTSTLKGTGVTQVAVSFINECSNIAGNSYIVFLSPTVSRNIQKEVFPSNFTFYEFGKHSLYGLRGKADLLRMKKLEVELKPDVVFSVFGPSLWRPRAPHVMGYAYPHYVYPELPIFQHMSIKEKISIRVRQWVHMNQLKHNGDYYVCETEDVSNRLYELYNIDKSKIFTISNTANSFFLNYKRDGSVNQNDAVFKFYSLCSPMPHKNLAILNEVVPLVKDIIQGRDVKFYVTISSSSYDMLFSDEIKDSVINVGPLKVAECPKFVDSCDALFMPTLLECFSASYPEAMILNKPILTSNLPFATGVCGDAALYFDPYNPYDIADKIVALINDSQLYENLQYKGRIRMDAFPTPRERAEAYLNICKSIC